MRALCAGRIYLSAANQSYAEIAHNDTLYMNHNMTVAIEVDVPENYRGWEETLCKGDRYNASYVIRFMSIGGVPKIVYGFSDGTGWRVVHTDMEDWYGKHVMIIGTSDENWIFKLYIDGELQAVADLSDYAEKAAKMTTPLRIGCAQPGYRHYTGRVSRVFIWKGYSLSDDEIKQLCSNPDKPPAKDRLVLWLPFVENMGVIAKDYSGNNNHARLYNCKWVSRARRGMYFDNGGIKFDSGLNIDCNYCSVVAVFAIETLKKRGDTLNGRNCIVRPNDEMLMLFNDPGDKKLRFTNYDGAWKEVVSNIELEAGQIYIGAGIVNGNEEHLYLASNGVIIDHNYRDDLGDCGEYTDTAIFVGSRNDGKYALHGEVLATMIYNRPITENEIKQISDFGWFNPPRNGLISWILFDGLKEGDVVKDLITGAIGEPIGTPKFVIRKPKRVLTR